MIMPLDRPRCAWAQATPELRKYHDQEYGFPVKQPQACFERLVLEMFQAGLSWRTILAKRQAFRRAFANFSPKKVAAFTSRDIQRLLADRNIIRNRLKIKAAVKNASAFLKLSGRPGGFGAFMRSLPLHDPDATLRAFRLQFDFMGPKIVEEFLRSTGYWPVSHEPGCFLAQPHDLKRKYLS
jgi:DNA-3-methyladenine glycosylase I